MRVSDTERQRTIDELRRHCAAGRLDVDEYAARLEKVMAATTLEELDRLTSDLPMVRIADPAGYRPVPITSPRDDRISRARLSATAFAVLTVAVLLTAVLIAVLASWGWSAVVLISWAIGVLQGRLSGRRR